MNDCIFCSIAQGEIPKDFTYEDDDVMVFPDIYPVKPIHFLIVPKKHIADFFELKDNEILIKLRDVAQKLIDEQKLSEKGYRLVINGGGAQVVYHLHIHLLGPLGKAAKM